MNTNGRRIVPVLIIGVTLAIGIMIGTFVSRGVRAARPFAGAADATPLPQPSAVELSNSFAKIADQIEPAVVNVNTESLVHVSRRFHGSPDDSPFGDFFDRFFGGQGGSVGPGGDLKQQSLGSGVILDKNGYILTNFHVVMQSGEDKPVDKINVSLAGDDDTRYKAKIVGSDKWTDLAVIKIDAPKPLPYASLGDSDSMRVGDWVLAVGSPFGLASTVTAGIISAKGRDIEGGTEAQFKRFIQTDAAINPGNSGGPLVNMGGQVIGINTAIATNRGTYDGVGFAIPSGTARKVYNAIITSGGVRRGAIGITFTNQNNPALLRSFGADHGVVVNGVEPGSPADHAGIQRGDVITSVDGKAIRSGDELVGIVSDTEIGKKLNLQVLRNNKTMSLDVEVADRDKIVGGLPDEAPEEPKSASGEESSGGILGVTVHSLPADVAPQLQEQLHLAGKQGVLVTDVPASGFASDLGVQRGDIILSINHKAITSVDDFNKAQAQLKSGNDVLLLIGRRSPPHSYATLFLADRLP
jgi:serine protease Do